MRLKQHMFFFQVLMYEAKKIVFYDPFGGKRKIVI